MNKKGAGRSKFIGWLSVTPGEWITFEYSTCLCLKNLSCGSHRVGDRTVIVRFNSAIFYFGLWGKSVSLRDTPAVRIRFCGQLHAHRVS